MKQQPVIDICDVVFDEQGWRAYLHALLGSAPRYLEVFAGRFGRLSGRSAASVMRAFAADPGSTIGWLAEQLGSTTPDTHVAHLATEGIRAQVLHGGSWPTTHGTVNDLVAAQVAAHPERLIGWAGVSLREPDSALAEATRALGELRMTGLSIIPFLDGVDVADQVHDPLWRLCVEHDVPVWIHSGQHFRTTVPTGISTPSVIDRIAGRHPGLRIIIGHGGWPWILEAIALLQRHPEVYLEFSSHDPATMARAGSGWEPLFLHGARSIRHQVMFGSTSWTHGRSVREIAERADRLPIDEAVRHAWLYGNAERMLRLDAVVSQ
ncbi:amidohydrolase [Nocardia speluncae]|uniref:Amidohydrolase n=1 Tax=Nocardia speluncae TaxID=419477 RepID=A0A846X9Z9_9NOCA|nr:amidohydrolase family protein [Nocardia speluncae]NKY31476.1 amidohydrolase [Nocardia speluncae]